MLPGASRLLHFEVGVGRVAAGIERVQRRAEKARAQLAHGCCMEM